MIDMSYGMKGWHRSRLRVNKIIKHFLDEYWHILLVHKDEQEKKVVKSTSTKFINCL